jgi:hypothetical protein
MDGWRLMSYVCVMLEFVRITVWYTPLTNEKLGLAYRLGKGR